MSITLLTIFHEEDYKGLGWKDNFCVENLSVYSIPQDFKQELDVYC